MLVSMASAVRATVATNFCPGNSCSVTNVLAPTFMIGCVGLRNAGINAQGIDAGEVKQFAAGRACARH